MCCACLSVHTTLSKLFPSDVAFRTELRTNRFLQGGNSWQPMNNGIDMTTLEDQVRRFQ